jgi:hypothetical protein
MVTALFGRVRRAPMFSDWPNACATALLGGIIAYAFDLGAFLQFIIAVALAAVLIAAFAGTRARSA